MKSISCGSRGGFSAFLSGDEGTLKSWAGYITGNNEQTVQNCVSYNQTENSLTSKTDNIVGGMTLQNYAGLASGKNSGTFNNVYVILMDSVTKFIGNDENSYKENIKTETSEIVSIVSLWANWSYKDNEFNVLN